MRVLVLAGTILVAGCSDSDPSGPETPTVVTPIDQPTLPPRGYYLGVLPTPAESQPLDSAYTQAAEFSEFVPVWAVGVGAQGFWDYPDALGGFGGSAIVGGLIRDRGMFPIIHFSFITTDTAALGLLLSTPASMPYATLHDSAWRAAYRDAVVAAVRKIRPLYLSTGNEVNRWYEQYGANPDNPNSFTYWVSLHNEIYDAVKAVSPSTIVFCVFAREIVDELREADMDVLNLFDPDKLDLLVFTSYPNAVKKDTAGAMLPDPVNRPADIPVDYYSRLESYMPGKPFGFSEISWPSENGFGGEQDQADFLSMAAGPLTVGRGVDLRMFGWCWLHNLINDFTRAEGSAGLIMRDGTEKTAYQVWKGLSTAGPPALQRVELGPPR